MKKLTSLVMALLAVAITFTVTWYGRRPKAPRQASWHDVMAEAGAGGYRIISTKALADQYSKHLPDMMLIDTRQAWEYRTGHIKGAVNFPMEPTGWARWRKAGALEKFLGPDKGRLLIFY